MKYHIDKNGKPAICKATKRPCPLGGAEAHFDTMEEAQAYADEQNKQQFGLLGVEKPSFEDLSVDMENREKRHDYMRKYYSNHKYLADNFNEFAENVEFTTYDIEDEYGDVKMTEKKAIELAEKQFVTATPDEMVEIATMWRPAFKSRADYVKTLETFANSRGMRNRRFL